MVISSCLQRAEASFWAWVSAQINYFIYSSKQTLETQKGKNKHHKSDLQGKVGEEMIINWNEIKFQKGFETILKV